MKDFIIGLAFIGFWVWCFAMWVFGEVFLFRAEDYFWAVIGLAFPPVGFLFGAYHWLF